MYRFLSSGGDNSLAPGCRVRVLGRPSPGAKSAACVPGLATKSLLLLLLALVVASCGGRGGEEGSARSAGPSAGYADEASPEPGLEAPPGSGAEGKATAGAAASSSASPAGSRVGAQGGAVLPGFDGEKIVKTAELGLRSTNVRGDASRAQEVAARFGGRVTSSRIDGGGDTASADLVLSVPSPEFEGALDELRGLGEVATDTVGGEDVTEEFVDLESRERNLLAAEESLLRLYEKATSVDDALSIERELTNLRGQVEVVQGRIQFLKDRTTTSRISLTIQPVEKPVEPRSALEPARVVSAAWNASLRFLGTVAAACISVVVFGWWLAPPLLAAGLWWTRRSSGHPGPTQNP
ncbi:MAG: hypothetical protein AVDCRST_MAG25-3486 [uncultured Rubrobacteraceae bacterium]|uniref:DUF4349 domain-containing protein n=1 Tax=uncultured Rubrobacteraceae bacterium TaxID=349277 RepID=A0A6J4S9A5_9ACTN|nr:MAG: hypothetical protein AVDCRST_MAG25-3486 [uncultured Rubrobacteraceae bacterium]